MVFGERKAGVRIIVQTPITLFYALALKALNIEVFWGNGKMLLCNVKGILAHFHLLGHNILYIQP